MYSERQIFWLCDEYSMNINRLQNVIVDVTDADI